MASRSGRKILVAPAWPYAAGYRHLGHAAAYVPFDVFARYHRLKGDDVLAVSGTDEHGTPVMVAADREGKPYAEVADFYNAAHREDFRRLGFTYDCFTRTTTENHERVTQDLFRTLYDRGAIFEQAQLVSFSRTTGHTLPDRYIEGTCPICGYPEARGDQCDNCGNQLDPTELIDPRSKIDGSTPEFRETNHLFLDLPAFADALRTWIRERGRTWRPNVRNFSLGLLDVVRARPITRDLDWGVRIPVPGYAEDENKRIYVWFDAVIGYLSASIEWAGLQGDPDAWRDWWQSEDALHAYFQGKDNIVFHTVIWPAIMLGYGEGGDVGAGRPLHLPDDVFATEYLTMESKQFSSSRSHGILLHDFLERYDPDPLRYYLIAASPETQDADFTWADFVRRNNDELLANWGNLVNRTLANAYRNFGVVPTPGTLTPGDQAVLDGVAGGFDSVGTHLEAGRFRAALGEVMRLASTVNQYISDQAPWAIVKTDIERAGTVLYVSLKAVDSLKTLFTPFLPHTAQQVHELLGHEGLIAGPLEFRSVEEDGKTHEILTGDYRSWVGAWEPSDLRPGQVLQEPRPLFKKLDESIVAEELERMQADDEP